MAEQLRNRINYDRKILTTILNKSMITLVKKLAYANLENMGFRSMENSSVARRKRQPRIEVNMRLFEGEIGRTYLVHSIDVEEKMMRRLEALGVNEQTPVTILNKKGSGTVIIKVRGTRLALGRRITEGIEIEEVQKDAS